METIIRSQNLPFTLDADSGEKSLDFPKYTFQIFDYDVREVRGEVCPITENEDKKMWRTEILVYGVTETGASICTRVINFYPFLYLAVHKLKKQWMTNELANLIQIYGKTTEWVHKAIIKDATSQPMKILKVSFESESKRRTFMYKLKNSEGFIYELKNSEDPKADIVKKKYGEPFDLSIVHNSDIKMHQQFITESKVRPCQWISVPYASVIENYQYKISSCQIETIVKFGVNKLTGQNDIILRPMISRNAPFMILAFDIEVLGRPNIFPQFEHDPICCICFQYYPYSFPDHKRNICLTFRGPGTKSGELPSTSSSSCGDFTIIECDNEIELIIRFSQIIKKLDVDVLTGYNSVNFDLTYIVNRSRHLMQKLKAQQNSLYKLLEEALMLSRLANYVCEVTEKSFDSKQRGKRKDYIVNLPGRIQFDLLPIIKTREKYNSYTLNNVAKIILGDTKEDVPHYLITPMFNRDAESQIKVLSYCVKDAVICVQIIEKKLLLISYIEDARTTHTHINPLIFSGQQEKALMQILPELDKNELIFPTPKNLIEEMTNKINQGKSVNTFTKDKYQGATVVEPKTGFYPDLVATCADFARYKQYFFLFFNKSSINKLVLPVYTLQL